MESQLGIQPREGRSGVEAGRAVSGGPTALNGRPPLNILVLADRDWTHPQGGGTGANVFANVALWGEWGHRVTVVAGHYPGAKRVERTAPNVVVYRMGGRATVFPRAMWAVLRGLGREADVVLEVINGITFLTPLWLRKPRVALVNHPHRDLFVGEYGARFGRVLSALLEELPVRWLYRRVPFSTISSAARDELVKVDGVPPGHITLAHCGVGPGPYAPGERSPKPRLLYLGRLKAYKRVEYLLDVLEALPGAVLDIAGHGDHRELLEAEISRRALGPRVHMHGWVDEERKAELYRRAWVHVTASSSEGWSLTVMEAALCGTPSVALAVGGLREAIVDGETGLLAHDLDELTRAVRHLIDDPELRQRLGDAALRRARTFTWESTAATNLALLHSQVAAARSRLPRLTRA